MKRDQVHALIRAAGTPAFFREHVLCKTQLEVAEDAGCSQTVVHLFEAAKVALTRARAQQLAPVLFPDLHSIDAYSAELAVFNLWFTVAEQVGSPRIKRYVNDRRAAFQTLGVEAPLWRNVVPAKGTVTQLPPASKKGARSA